MNPFTFYNPVKLVFGENALDKLPRELSAYGDRVLVVYGGGSIKKNGVYEAVIEKLQEANKEIFELANVEPNPRLATAKKGIALCQQENIDFILAVGGGSVIDCAKLIAAGVYYEGDAWDIVLRKVRVKEALPFGTVLTIAATGSEMNAGSVITNGETNEKRSWGSAVTFPKVSFLNPAFTTSVPRDHTVYGIVDMMSHILEQYFHNAPNTLITDAMAEGVLQTIIQTAPALVDDLHNVQLRETILLAGTIGLNGFLAMGSQGDWATHDIEHAVSAVYDIPHAGGLAILQPHWMRQAVPQQPERFAGLAERVFGVTREGKSVEEVAYEGIDRLSAFWQSLGAPSKLSDYNIDDRQFDYIVAHAMAEETLGNFKLLEAEDVKQILVNAQ